MAFELVNPGPRRKPRSDNKRGAPQVGDQEGHLT